MIIYVWAEHENNAIERAYDCRDYKTEAAALKAAESFDPLMRKWLKLFKIDVANKEIQELS